MKRAQLIEPGMYESNTSYVFEYSEPTARVDAGDPAWFFLLCNRVVAATQKWSMDNHINLLDLFTNFETVIQLYGDVAVFRVYPIHVKQD